MATAPSSPPVLQDMIERGYFPKEVPPTFTTAQLAPVAVANSVAFEAAYSGMKVSHACRFQFARPGTLRRALAAPNPAFYCKLAQEICSRWSDIETNLNRSRLSISKPMPSVSGRRSIQPETNHNQLFDMRCKYRSHYRFLLQADISQFYPNIYTHSIAWAIEGKANAKANRFANTLGNNLDKIVQNGQDGQTKGIPIGPDGSLVIAEILLSASDQELESGIRNLRGFRYYDDYEFYFDSRAKADEALTRLESVLSQYEITLNSTKTKVETVLQPLDFPWSRIRRVEIRSRNSESQRSDLIFLFDEAFDLSRQRPADHVLKYAIGRLDDVNILGDNIELYIRLLCQAAMIEPAVLPIVLNQMLALKEADPAQFKKVAIKTNAIALLLNKHVMFHAHQGNSSEVAWAIWGAIALKIRLNSDASKAICVMEDSFVALLALYAHKESSLMDKRSVNDAFWLNQMTGNSLRGDHWLLSYEAVARGWYLRTGIVGLSRQDQAALDFFELLDKQGVKFFESRFNYIDELESTQDYGSAEADELDPNGDIPF